MIQCLIYALLTYRIQQFVELTFCNFYLNKTIDITIKQFHNLYLISQGY